MVGLIRRIFKLLQEKYRKSCGRLFKGKNNMLQKNTKSAELVICPKCNGQNLKGTIVPRNCKWCGENSVFKEEYLHTFEDEEVCTCKFSEDGKTILELCPLHKEYFNKNFKALEELTFKLAKRLYNEPIFNPSIKEFVNVLCVLGEKGYVIGEEE